MRWTLWALFGGLVALLLPRAAEAAAPRMGQAIDVAAGLPDLLPGGTADHPYLSSVRVGRDWLEPAPGESRMDELRRRLEALAVAHHQVLLWVPPAGPGGSPLDRGDAAQVREWSRFLRELAGRAGPSVVAFQPLDAPGRDVLTDAFLLKQSAVAIRSARPQALVALGLPRGPADEEWLRGLYEAEVEPYVDAWAWRAGGSDPAAAGLPALAVLRLTLDPSAGLWVNDLPGGGEGPRSEAALFGAYASAGAGLITFQGGGAAILSEMHRRLPPGYIPTPPGGVRFTGPGGGSEAGLAAYRFFDAERALAQVLVVPVGPVPERVQVILDTFDVSSPVLYDPATGEERFLTGALPDRSANRTTLTLTGIGGPVFLEYKRFATPGLGREEVGVRTQRDPSVEEILARHQEVKAAGDAGVDTVMADALIEFHYTIAGSGATFDVAYRSRYYRDADGRAEFEHLEMLLNGSRWNRDKLPNLPLIQPEKVVTPPLEINMGRQYAYRLRGRDEVGGRPAWKIDFNPLDGEATRLAGTAWIDRESYRLLKLSVVQTGLEAPVLSNEEMNLFAEHPVPGGGTASLVSRIEGQQIWNTAGLNLVVNREIRFDNVRINAPEFGSAREAAYASDRQILRDTDQGLRYLVKDDAGGRVVQMEPDSRSRFILGGGFYNEALDFPVPFAGVNWFDYDVGGRGRQLNLFLAGAANFLTFSDPTVWGTRADASVSAGLIGFASTDRFFVDGQELEGVEVKGRQQSLSASLGLPLGEFVKIRGFYALSYDNYQLGEDTSPGFVAPRDGLTHSLAGSVQLNRRGFTATALAEAFQREDWEAWGDADPLSAAVGSRLVDFSDRFESYSQWSLALSQDWFVAPFQKVRLSGTWLDGQDLDRFSQYQFSFFSERTRVRGFSGSGIRFDEGGLARVRYSFNVADLVTFDAGIDHARAKNLLTDAEFLSHTGIGFAGKFVGPWGFVIQVEYGYALRSDIEAVEGEQEAQILFLRIF